MRAKDLGPELVQTYGQSDSEWTVKSNTNEFTVYYVRLENQSCDCKLHCDMCNACVHMYTCSCLDATLHYIVCKHVHLVQMKIVKTAKIVTEMTTIEENEEEYSDMKNDVTTQAQVELPVQHDNHCTNTLDKTVNLEQQCDEQFDESFADHEQASKGVPMDLEQNSCININSAGENGDLHSEVSMKNYYSSMLKEEKCVNRMATLHGEIEILLLKLNTMQKQCCQLEILSKVKKHVNPAVTITEAALVSPSQCVSSLPVRKQCSPNAIHKKQLRFYPTKRKCEKSKQNCTKSTPEEVKSTKETLNNTDIVVCAICFKEDDKCSDKYVEWIQCERCEIWMHAVCTNQHDANFACNYCN